MYIGKYVIDWIWCEANLKNCIDHSLTSETLWWWQYSTGSVFLCFLCCSKLVIIRYHTPKQRKIIFHPRIKLNYNSRAVHSGGAKGAVAPARKTKCFFSNIVSDFAGLFLVAILVRNLTKTEFAPADKKS